MRRNTLTMTAMEGFKPVGENGEYPIDGNQEGFSKYFEHDTWKNSFSLPKEIIDDAKAMDLKRQPETFIASYYRTRELPGAALYGTAIGRGLLLNSEERPIRQPRRWLAVFTRFTGQRPKVHTRSPTCLPMRSPYALSAGETKMQLCRRRRQLIDISPDTIVIPNPTSLKGCVCGCRADKDLRLQTTVLTTNTVGGRSLYGAISISIT